MNKVAVLRIINPVLLRFADISQMNIATSGPDGGGYAPGKAPVTNAAGNTVKFDFSGLVANIGVMFRR